MYLGIIRPGPNTKLKPAGMAKAQTKAKVHEQKLEEPPVEEDAGGRGSKVKTESEQVLAVEMEELNADLEEVGAALQDAMRSRDGKAIRKLMAERNRLNMERRKLKEKLDDKAAELSPSRLNLIRHESDDDDSDPRARIQKALQEAMRKRDTKAIRRLMKERAQLNKIEATEEDNAKEARAKAMEEEAAKEAAATKEKATYTLHRARSFESLDESDDEKFVFPAEGTQFVEEFCKIFAQAKSKDPQYRAAIYERWQMFELCNEADVRVVRRAA